MPDSRALPDHCATSCPTCGQAVEVVVSDEGTSHYAGLDAWDASTLRTERDAAILSATTGLRKALAEAVEWVPEPECSRLRSALDERHNMSGASGLYPTQVKPAVTGGSGHEAGSRSPDFAPTDSLAPDEEHAK